MAIAMMPVRAVRVWIGALLFSIAQALGAQTLQPLPTITSRVTDTTGTLSSSLGQINASGLGWACPVAGQVVTCTRSNGLAPGGFYPSISVTAVVGSGAAYSSCAQVTHDVNAATQPDLVPGNNLACANGAISRRVSEPNR